MANWWEPQQIGWTDSTWGQQSSGGEDFFYSDDSGWQDDYNLYYDPSFYSDTTAADRLGDIEASTGVDFSSGGPEDGGWLGDVWDSTKEAVGGVTDWLLDSPQGGGFLSGLLTGGMNYMSNSERNDMLEAQNADELAYRYAALAQQADTDAARIEAANAATAATEHANAIRERAQQFEEDRYRTHNASINRGPQGGASQTFSFSRK